MIMRVGSILVALSLLSACDAEGDKAAAASHGQEKKPAPATPAAAAPAASSDAQPVTAADDAKLRRKYGPAEMKYNGCAKRQENTIVGRGCPSTIVVYGPYVAVPANSEIDFSFEIQATSAVNVYSDMFAQVGKRALGALNTQAIPANEKRKLGYRINNKDADTALEARVWVHGTGPTDFEITNLSVTVR